SLGFLPALGQEAAGGRCRLRLPRGLNPGEHPVRVPEPDSSSGLTGFGPAAGARGEQEGQEADLGFAAVADERFGDVAHVRPGGGQLRIEDSGDLEKACSESGAAGAFAVKRTKVQAVKAIEAARAVLVIILAHPAARGVADAETDPGDVSPAQPLG